MADCAHQVQFQGLCALCGAVMPTEKEESVNVDYNSAIKATPEEAARLTRDNMASLLKDRKLLLVVDLDQTVVHASFDPAIGKWMNASHPSTVDVLSFNLPPDQPNSMVYYLKLRPGLAEFMKEISKLYELHIYTMGTGDYARKVAEKIDPDGSLFGQRIFFREKNGNMSQKKIQREFLCDAPMIAIIDDRSDVWNNSRNLLKIKRYEFFVGTGDINSPVKPEPNPRRQEAAKAWNPTPQAASKPEVETPPNPTTEPLSEQPLEQPVEEPVEEPTEQPTEQPIEQPVEQAVEPPTEISTELATKSATEPSIDKPTTENAPLEEQVNKDDEINQLKEQRDQIPLEQKQTELPFRDDDDRELYKMLKILRDVHARFYAAYDEAHKEGAGSPNEDVQKHPDVRDMIATTKKDVLEGVNIVFSGVIPLRDNPAHSAIWRLAESFGATCSRDLTGKTTHLVAKEDGTDKVKKARKYSSGIHIVLPTWLEASTDQWTHLDEKLYELPVCTPLPDTESEMENQESSLYDFDINPNSDDLHLESFDWDEADKEVDDCLDESGTDLGDTDSEATDSQRSEAWRIDKRKRDRGDGDDGGASGASSDDEADAPGRHHPRKKITKHGPSHLSRVTTAHSTDSSSERSDDESDSQLNDGENGDDESSTSFDEFADFLDEELE